VCSRSATYLDVCPEEQLVGAVGKPQSLNVLDGLDVVQHSIGGNEVDSEAQRRPPGHHNGEHSQPDGHLLCNDSTEQHFGATT